MARPKLTIVKLGGSLITVKDRREVLNRTALTAAARALAAANARYVVVHGGGSFGHYHARRYGISRRVSRADPGGVLETRAAMHRLSQHVTQALITHDFHAFNLPPCAFIRDRYLLPHAPGLFRALLQNGYTPLTYGDVLAAPQGIYIISGDDIVDLLVPALQPENIVFALAVDGLYREPQNPATLLSELSYAEASHIRTQMDARDVTGGMELKLGVAARLAGQGYTVRFVNGRRYQDFLRALQGEAFHGTVITPPETGEERKLHRV